MSVVEMSKENSEGKIACGKFVDKPSSRETFLVRGFPYGKLQSENPTHECIKRIHQLYIRSTLCPISKMLVIFYFRNTSYEIILLFSIIIFYYLFYYYFFLHVFSKFLFNSCYFTTIK